MLSKLDEDERYRRFDVLQARMGEIWDAMRLNHDDESVVVVPSITLDRAVASSGSITQSYEERFLFLLMLLRQPRLRMVYVTSMPIAPEIIEYYLALLPGVIPSHARSRLSLVAVHDASPRSLSEKLLERPHLLARIAALIPNRARSHLVPYNTTELERDVALCLGIPMYGADPRLAPLGSKTGCRRMFAEAGIPHPLGVENLRTLDDMTDAVVGMRAERASMDSVIVKLNDGVSGEGNALVRLGGLPAPGSSDERAAVRERLLGMELESPTTPLDVYLAKFEEGAGIVEERIAGQEVRSPSVQLRVLPGGAVELLSTHDQLLGGASGQSYLGCTFPAAPEYARAITEHAETIGRRLADQGALGRFAIDFVVVRGSERRVDAVRDRAQPSQGRDDPPVPHAAVPHRRPLRPDDLALPHPPRAREAPGRHRPSRVRAAPRPGAVRPVRHRGPTRTPLRPVAPGRDRLPHDQLPHRARPDRPHRGR